MFTGLIEVVGTIHAVRDTPQGRELTVASPWQDLVMGESVAINGACLTVMGIEGDRFTVQVVATSRDRTAFADYQAGRRVHLERAMRLGDRLGGHLVQGHVDGVATVERVEQQGDTWVIDLKVPEEVAAVTIPLGSITVDGVSLTANAVPRHGIVQLAIIPFTLEHTTLGELRPGDRVHVEGDLVGKYVRQQAAAWRAVAEG